MANRTYVDLFNFKESGSGELFYKYFVLSVESAPLAIIKIRTLQILSISEKTLDNYLYMIFSVKCSNIHTGANVDIITIEEGEKDDYRTPRNRSGNRTTSPFRDRVQERFGGFIGLNNRLVFLFL